MGTVAGLAGTRTFQEKFLAVIDRCLLDLFLQLKAQVICFLHIKPMKAKVSIIKRVVMNGIILRAFPLVPVLEAANHHMSRSGT